MKKIRKLVDEIFEHDDEMNCKAAYEEVAAFSKFEDAYEINEFLREKFEDYGIEVNYWNVKEFCEVYKEKSLREILGG